MAMTRNSISVCTQRFISVVGALGTGVSAYWGWDMVFAVAKWMIPGMTLLTTSYEVYFKTGQLLVSTFSTAVGYKVTSVGIATSIGQHNRLGDDVELLKTQNEQLLKKDLEQANRLRSAEAQIDRLTTSFENARLSIVELTRIIKSHIPSISENDKQKLDEKAHQSEQDSRQNQTWFVLRHRSPKRHAEKTPDQVEVVVAPVPAVPAEEAKESSSEAKDQRSISAAITTGHFKRKNSSETSSLAQPLLRPGGKIN